MLTTSNLKTIVRPNEEAPMRSPFRPLTTSTMNNRAEQGENRAKVLNVLSALKNTPLDQLLGENPLTECPRVWVLGGGPSLGQFDCTKLSGEVVIGANRCFEKPEVGISMSLDKRFHRWIMDGEYGAQVAERWNDFPGIRLFSLTNMAGLTEGNEDPFYYVLRDNETLAPSVHRLQSINNSGACAIQLALALGAKEINLLGFDMKGAEGKQAWWHSDHPVKSSDQCYDTMKKDFKKLVDIAASLGATITNFSEGSALDVFKKSTHKAAYEVLSKKPNRPMVCGFYTEKTDYEHIIKPMTRTAKGFGLDTWKLQVPNKGHWEFNCLEKPSAILRALDAAQGKDVLYLDADAVICKYPRLFDDFEGEFGACYFDWKNVPNSSRTEVELSSAVLYCKNTKNTRELLKEWEEACIHAVTKNEKIWDQKLLEPILERMMNRKSFKFVQIPMNYNQIFDTMAGLGEPVIVQNQASRVQRHKVGLCGC